MYNSVIIGAGAAGLFIASNLKGDNNLLIESQNRVGKKILITGGGMCNITNCDSPDEFLKRFGDKKRANFLKPALYNLPPEKTRELLEEWGLNLTIREDGKVFPESLKAQSIIDTLQRRANIKTKYNLKITSVKKEGNYFLLNPSNEAIKCKNLIVATGGKSFPNTGSDGSGYKLALALGHKIIRPKPALAGIKVENYLFKELAGNSIRSSLVDFYREGENRRYHQATGDILFTHQGLSGPGILNNSRLIEAGDTLHISLLPCSNREEIREEIVRIVSRSNRTINQILKELGIFKTLREKILKILNLRDITTKELGKKRQKELINTLISLKIKVGATGGFNSAMVTAGGVDIGEINRKNMESKVVPGLFFAGEVVDIDGDTGGYNIQAAFSTGKLITDYLNRGLET